MRTLWLGELPTEVEDWLDRRRRWGADTHDEVWNGVLHVASFAVGSHTHSSASAQVSILLAPAARDRGLHCYGPVNIGAEDDYRVPDGVLHRSRLRGLWHPTAAFVVEIISPEDETWEKLPFYAAHGADELLIVNPDTREVHWLGLADGEYQPIEHSGLIDLGPAQLARQIDWP
jgi:Uma2 family endonuclease